MRLPVTGRPVKFFLDYICPRASSRCFSSLQTEPELIILNPRQAGLVKVKPRRPKRRTSKPFSVTEPMPISPLEGYEEKRLSEEPVASAIHSQKPESINITRQRFEEIRDDLSRGFKKAHLQEYLKSQKISPALFKRLTKDKLAQFIMTGVWKCQVRDDVQQSGGGVFVENVLELSEQDLVLVLGGNGHLLREWSKSGARLSISPSRSQIIVNSTQETFDWINASLSHFLESVMTTEIDITELKHLVDPHRFPEHLAAIQQLTDTYFRGGGATDFNQESIVVYSAGNNKIVNTNVVKRLLVQLTQPALVARWKPADWWFDTSAAIPERSYFQPFDDTDSLEWMERMRLWSRWECPKRRKQTKSDPQPQLHTVKLQKLAKAEFDLTTSLENDEPRSLQSQMENIIRDLSAKHPVKASLNGEPVSTTLTITPGYVLHEFDEKATVPHSGTAKAFSSNIPYVSNLASTLPLYSKDIKQEDPLDTHRQDVRGDNMLAPDLFTDPSPEQDSTDENLPKVFAFRRKELDLQSNLRLIQIKYVANPQQGLATKYPPIEAWAELPQFQQSSNSLLQEIPRLIAVPLEASSHISLPERKADFKISIAHTYPVKITPDVEEYFMKHCRFGRVGPIEIKPELKVELGGEIVSYLYHSASYVTLAELEFHEKLLQLSQVEGGKLGGRKIEASLIDHAESPAQIDLQTSAKRLVESAVAFTNLL